MAQSFLLAPGTSAEDLAARRRLAMNLLQKGSSGAPVGHWLQGANRAVQGLMGGWDLYNIEQAQKAERDQANKLLGEVFGTSGVTAGGGPQTSSAPAQRAPSGGGSRSLADRIIGVESGGDSAATNPRTSATGSGQFINSTWLDMVKRNRPDLAAGKSDQELLALRTDPELSRQMVDAYAAENAVTLDRAGYEPTDANTYLAHFAGPAGAKAVLGADPNTPVGQVLGDRVVQANPFLANMTAGDLVGWAQRKMGGGQPAASPAAPPTAGPAVDPDQPRPVATTTIDPATGNPMAAGPQAGPQPAPAQTNALGIDQNTAQLIQKLAGNRHTAPLANQLLTAAMTPKSPKDRYVSSGGGLFDMQTQQWMMPPTSGKPTNDMREYEFAMQQRQSSGQPPIPFDQWKQESKAPLVTIQGEKEYDKTRGKALAEDFGTVQADAHKATNAIGHLRQIDSLLSNPNVYTGTGGTAINALKRAAQTLLGQDSIKGVADADAAGRISTQMALSLKDELPGPMSDSDRRFLQEIPPNIGDTAQGRKLLVELMVAKEERKIEIAELARDYAREKGRLDDGWYNMLARYNAQNPVFTPEHMAQARAVSEQGQQQSPAAGVLPRVTDTQSYEAIPRGSRYIDPQGKIRTKN